jgi:hypothetical protein
MDYPDHYYSSNSLYICKKFTDLLQVLKLAKQEPYSQEVS